MANYDSYKVYRERWTHEDTLILNRNVWLILFQSSIIALYYILFVAVHQEHDKHLVLEMVDGFALPCVGVVYAIFINVAIGAAFKAMDAVDEAYKRLDAVDRPLDLYPSGEQRVNAKNASKALPWIYGLLWIGMAVFAWFQ